MTPVPPPYGISGTPARWASANNLGYLRSVRRPPHTTSARRSKSGIGVVGPVRRQGVGRIAIQLGRFGENVFKADDT